MNNRKILALNNLKNVHDNIKQRNFELHSIEKVIKKRKDNYKGILYKNPVMIDRYKELRDGANEIFLNNANTLIHNTNMFSTLN